MTIQHEMAMQYRINERVVNGALAEILTESANLSLVSEATASGTGGAAPDFLIRPHYSQNRSVAIEAKVGTSTVQRNAAIADAQQRLADTPNVYAAIALCYPDHIANAHDHSEMIKELEGSRLHFVEVTESGPVGEWHKGFALDLATAIIYAGEGIAQSLANSLNNAIELAMRSLSDVNRQLIAEALELPGKPLMMAGKQAVNEYGNPMYDYSNAAKIGCLMLLNGIMMQSRLVESGVFAKRGIKVPTPEVCMADDTPQIPFIEAWKTIREIDYHPIYDAALQTLLSLSDPWSVKRVLTALYDGASRVVSNVAEIRSDLAGRIYHRLLDTARFDGSFYTSTPAAILLARLALTSDLIDWSDPEEIIKLRICDPACGTGTLLMAAAQVCRERHLVTNGNGSTDELMHLHMVEDVLNGMDINLSAVHLAASMLTLANPNVDFNRMGIYRVRFGVERNKGANGSKSWLGSLEMLQGIDSRLQFPDHERSDGEPAYPDLRNLCDVVIMNPPFTRDSLRHDQLSSEDQSEMKKAEAKLLNEHPDGKAVHRSTASTMFNLLGDYLAKDESAVLARVMPATEGVGTSAQPMRKLLNQKWHIETVITSHDPRRIFFSEDTSITETLMVARRRERNAEPKPTKFINLARNPGTAFEALGLAKAIEEDDLINWGITQWNPATAMSDGDWLPMLFYDPSLTSAVRMLRDGLNSKLKKLGDIAQIGPDDLTKAQAFSRTSSRQSENMMALWYHKSEKRTAMRAEPDQMITARRGKEHIAQRWWDRRSNLLIANRLYPVRNATPIVFLDTPVIGSAWMPVTPNDCEGLDKHQIMKAWCVWGNSSAGLVSFIGISQRKLTYPEFSMVGLRSLPFPDPESNLDAIAALAEVYDNLRDSTLLPLPQANECDTRLAIDTAVANALGNGLDDIHSWRRLIAIEPNVCQKPAIMDG